MMLNGFIPRALRSRWCNAIALAMVGETPSSAPKHFPSRAAWRAAPLSMRSFPGLQREGHHFQIAQFARANVLTGQQDLARRPWRVAMHSGLSRSKETHTSAASGGVTHFGVGIFWFFGP